MGRILWRALLWSFIGFFVVDVSRAADGVSERFFRTSDGVKLHYLEAGRGPETMVFIPGWLMPAAVFDAQVRELSRRFRVISFDPRSQGKSEVFNGAHTPEARCRDIHELLNVVKPTKPILAGWSLGVMEVLDYLAHYQPADLAGLVLIDNSIGEGSPPSGGTSKSGSGSAGPKDRSAYLRDFTLSLTKKPLADPLFKAIYASALQVPQEAARELLRKPYPREYWRDTLLAQSVPVLYVIRPRYEEQGEALLRKRPTLAKVELFTEAGHALFLDEPTRFNSVVTAFAEKTWALAPKGR
jgi:microsomal epoxide hydrolase